MTGAKFMLSEPVHVTCNTQGHNSSLSNPSWSPGMMFHFYTTITGCPKVPEVALRSPYLNLMKLITLTGDWQAHSSKDWVCSHVRGGQGVGTWRWDTTVCHVWEYVKLYSIFLAEEEPIAPGLVWSGKAPSWEHTAAAWENAGLAELPPSHQGLQIAGKGLPLFITWLPGCNQGIDESQSGTTPAWGQTHMLGGTCSWCSLL